MNEIEELFEDQWKWLNKFKSINLNHWRCIGFGNSDKHNLFMYVGEDYIYSDRKKNLMSNRYYYWPDESVV